MRKLKKSKRAKRSVVFSPSHARQIGEAMGIIVGIAAAFSSNHLFDTNITTDYQVTEDADFEIINPKLLNNDHHGRK